MEGEKGGGAAREKVGVGDWEWARRRSEMGAEVVEADGDPPSALEISERRRKKMKEIWRSAKRSASMSKERSRRVVSQRERN